MKKLLAYALLLAGTLGLALYPRLLGADAPPALRSDGFVGFVHGICIGLEVLAVMLVVNAKRAVPVRIRTDRN